MHSSAISIDSPLVSDASMSATSDRDPTIRLFWLLATGHVFVWMAVCLLTQPNMPLDMVEMLYWGQQWQAGYHKHPPLPAWTAATAWYVGGGPWAIYLVSQLTVIATFWAVWQFARESLTPWAALCSVAVLEGCYYCTFMVNDMNNTIVTRPMWALAILFLYRAIARRDARAQTINWCLCGAFIGLGMISKYYMAVIVISMIAVPVLMPRTRKALATPGPWMMTGISLLIFAPHFVWMVQNDFISIRYVFNRSGEAAASGYSPLNHIVKPVSFLVSQAGAVVPVLVLAVPLLMNWRRRRVTIACMPDENGKVDASFFNRFLMIVFFGPILIYILLSLTTGATIRSMWGGPLFSFLGVVLFALIKLPEDHSRVRKIFRDSIIVGLLMALALAGRNELGPKMRNELSRVHFPGVDVSRQINDAWSQRYMTDLETVGGDMFIAGCVGVYSDKHIDVYGGLVPQANPWTSDNAVQQRGGVIVWDQGTYGDTPPDHWLARFTSAEVVEPIVCKCEADIEVRVGIAIVHPFDATVVARHGTSNGDNAASRARTANIPGTTSPIER